MRVRWRHGRPVPAGRRRQEIACPSWKDPGVRQACSDAVAQIERALRESPAELEAVLPPAGRGTELEQAPIPEGRGTELTRG